MHAQILTYSTNRKPIQTHPLRPQNPRLAKNIRKPSLRFRSPLLSSHFHIHIHHPATCPPYPLHPQSASRPRLHQHRKTQPQEKRTAPPRHRTPQAQPQKKRSQRPDDFDPLTHDEHTDYQIRSGTQRFRTRGIDADGIRIRISIRAVCVRAAAPETAPARYRSVACVARAEFAECAGDAEVGGVAAVELSGGERRLDG